jgi:hypothetical protein
MDNEQLNEIEEHDRYNKAAIRFNTTLDAAGAVLITAAGLCLSAIAILATKRISK